MRAADGSGREISLRRQKNIGDARESAPMSHSLAGTAKDGDIAIEDRERDTDRSHLLRGRVARQMAGEARLRPNSPKVSRRRGA